MSTTTTAKPTILLIPGSFSTGTVYDSLATALSLHPSAPPLQILTLPTVGKRPGELPTMYTDAAFINAAARALADEGKEIILMAHSYGGVPASEALKGITKKEREREGKRGGVVRVAYMTALVPEVGGNATRVLDVEGGIETPDYLGVDEDGWLYHADPERIASIVFSALPADQAREAGKFFVQHSGPSFANELTHAGYKDVPASYLFCEEDLCVVPAVQQRGIDNIEKASGRKVDVTRIATDHVPHLSKPEGTVEWLVGLAEKGGRE
ncbi:alpha/beta-hydrolase [Byssothecium circinans]|uniref:Alpha/beta-hydrolase n=1 Tax=Byssothecium circinans TaxID=147558 RepID=A0A6A5UAF1_9PLEO|nr:alpha/beta-hydrolase [Byssothecium circinans]